MRSRVLLGLGIVIVSAIVLGIALKYLTRSQHPNTVVVPAIENRDASVTFDRLRESGLRVTIPATTHFYATSSPTVVGQTPRAGTRVDWDSVVTLRIRPGLMGTPIGPGKLPVYRVPDFDGKPLANAVAWTRGKWVHWTTDLPPLPPSSAKHLFDAYVVTSQRPAAGSDVKLWIPVQVRKLGVGVRLTPLVLDVALR